MMMLCLSLGFGIMEVFPHDLSRRGKMTTTCNFDTVTSRKYKVIMLVTLDPPTSFLFSTLSLARLFKYCQKKTYTCPASRRSTIFQGLDCIQSRTCTRTNKSKWWMGGRIEGYQGKYLPRDTSAII